MDAVRVPPSACKTSQSSIIERSPSAFISVIARSDRPIKRWISSVRPPCLPRVASRPDRVCVARGSMPYSPVTQPLPLPRIQPGTRSSMLAVHSTCVSPKEAKTLPSACFVKSVTKRTSRIVAGSRPLGRMIILQYVTLCFELAAWCQLSQMPSYLNVVPVVLSLWGALILRALTLSAFCGD